MQLQSDPFHELKAYFESGLTIPYEFRRQRLIELRIAISTHIDEIANALKSDLGKSPTESYFTETDMVFAEIDYHLANLKKWMKPQRVTTPLALEWSSSQIVAQPKGVALIISPWNFPIQLTLVPLISAISAGCTVLVKPSELAPHSSAIIAAILNKTFEPNYIIAVQGKGEILIPAWIDKHPFNHIFFTGSTTVGKKIAEMAAKHLSSFTLELGGKSPVIISESGGSKVAAKRIVWGKFLNCGQTCIAPDYLLIEESIYKEFTQLLIAEINNFFGKNQEESPDYGRIINDRRFDHLLKLLDGEKIVFGGNHNAKLRYLQPTLVKLKSTFSPLIQEEIFGPILPIITFRTHEEAIEIIKLNPYPLAAYYFGKDKYWENYFRNQLPFGGGVINNTLYHISNHNLPFGGMQTSGFGSYHGRFGFNAFTHFKSLMKTANWLDVPLKYPPFTPSKSTWLKRLLKISRSK